MRFRGCSRDYGERDFGATHFAIMRDFQLSLRADSAAEVADSGLLLKFLSGVY